MKFLGSVLFGSLAVTGCLDTTSDELTTEGAQRVGKNGTTLAASKTIDICKVDASTWRYSGEVSVWNEGAVNTQGFSIFDCIQNKAGSGQFVDVASLCQMLGAGSVIPAGTTQLTAIVFPYSIDGAPLAGDIRNRAKLTITNHSGNLGTPFGPEPKATWLGGEPPPCEQPPAGCTHTQGYWGSKPGVEYPAPYVATDLFYLSGYTWEDILDVPAGGNGYFLLAHQFIAASLNAADDASVPAGVQNVLNLAAAWFATATLASCPKGSSCGLQKTWAGILDDFNNGVYPGGPGHCE